MNDVNTKDLQINKENEETNEYRKKNNFITTPPSSSSSSSSCSEISVEDMTNVQEEKNDLKKINNTNEVNMNKTSSTSMLLLSTFNLTLHLNILQLNIFIILINNI